MQNAKVVVPKPVNEPVLEYRPNSPERISLINKINDLKSQNIEIPLIIDGNEIQTITGTRPRGQGCVLGLKIDI